MATNELTINGLVAVQRAELTNFVKDGQEIVVLNMHLGFSSFAAAATALAAIGAAVSAPPSAAEPAAKPAKAVAAAVVAKAAEVAAPAAAAAPATKPAPAKPAAAPSAAKAPAAPAKPAPAPPAAAAQKAAAAVAASGGPRAPSKPPAAVAPKPATAPKPPAVTKPKPPEPEPSESAEDVPAPELTEFQGQALEAFNEIEAAKLAKGENPLNFKDVMLWLIAAYGGEGEAFDEAALNVEAITADVQALRTSVAAIDRVPEADLVDRIKRAVASLLTQRAG